MDGSAEEIVFDEGGVCNFCHQAQHEMNLAAKLRPDLESKVQGIRSCRKGNYDCLIGLSGGVDSSLLLLKAVEMGLRPLCFSVDNGWNDIRADENIMKLVEGMKVPFYRYTIDVPKFRRLQAAFIRQGQKNIEIPTDHILMAASLEVADMYGIKTILSGGNAASESIMPASWGYNARDLVHIKDVYWQTFHVKLSGLPMCSLLKWNWYRWVRGIHTVYLLDYIDYNRSEAIKTLQNKFGWSDYGAKHEESLFTSWFQNFYLYQKFGIDKRKAHLSSLINSGQITRSEALKELRQSPVYPRLGLEERVMSYPIRPYTDFRTDERLYRAISSFVKLWKS